MSFAATQWAYSQRCGSGVAKSVLAYLADCASLEGGDCYPSLDKIVHTVEHTERAVRRAIASLIDKKLIEREHRFAPNGRCTSPIYRLPVVVHPTPAKTQGYDFVAPTTTPPTPAKTQGTEGGENAGVTPAKTQGNPSLEKETPVQTDSIQNIGRSLPQQQQSRARARPRAAAARSLAPVMPDFIDRQAWDAYNAAAKAIGVSTARSLRGDRLLALRERVGDCGGIEGWCTAMEELTEAEFLAGKDFVTLSWVLDQRNFDELRDGKYRRIRKPTSRQDIRADETTRHLERLRKLVPQAWPMPDEERAL